MRIAFTILYEGLFHLKHLNFAEKMAEMFDHWIVVEGHALPHGSTRHCRMISVPATSQDGTIQFMNDFALSHKNVHFYSHGTYYNSKDTQVNVAIQILKSITGSCYLWEVDMDEHWTDEKISQAERIADTKSDIGFKFQFNHYVGDNLIAKGEWGSGYLNRLWKWSGQLFASHEPALLRGQRRTLPIDGIMFEHYSYIDPATVLFKSRYYKGHEKVYENWKSIQNRTDYPIHISELFGKDSHIGRTNSLIHKI